MNSGRGPASAVSTSMACSCSTSTTRAMRSLLRGLDRFHASVSSRPLPDVIVAELRAPAAAVLNLHHSLDRHGLYCTSGRWNSRIGNGAVRRALVICLPA